MATLSAFADQLRSTLDIVEVIGAYLPLKKRGKEHQVCCPFHHEKTASFKVSSAKQIFHCFGCHKGGDVIKFVQEFEHLDFRAAVTLLAERNGIAVPSFSGPAVSSEEEKRRMALCEVHKLATEFFGEQLARNSTAVTYLEKRGITHDIVDVFGLGFAPEHGNLFLAHARKKGYSDGLLREAGLVKDSGEGHGPYDAFRGRVIFPICDPVGRVVAFGGRVLDKDGQPKYLNSTETPIYQKGRFLYAYHLAKNAIKERGYAIVTEGYMDAIACHQFGFINTVASLGTATTDAMARLLRRLCTNVVYLYDGDEAGQKAMYGGTQVLLAHDFQVRVVALPPEDDPDSLLRREGVETLRQRIERAPDHFDYFVQAAARSHDRTTLEGRIAIIEHIGELVGRTRHPVARHDYVRRLAEFLAIPESVVSQSLFGRTQKAREAIADAVSDGSKSEQADRHETGLLRLLIEHERARDAARSDIQVEWLFHPKVKSWFERILAADASQLALPSVLELAEDENDAAFLRAVLLAESEPLADFERLYPEMIAYLASRYYDALTRNLHKQIAEAGQQGPESLMAELVQKKIEISRKKRLLGEARYGKWYDLSVLGSASGAL
jgi:DNA primase